ncbi:MAG TPA: hypothetical protein PKX64_07980 [Elusimicrobiota bacterium]|nr:hypothetical protein [Elusimicrobiota bacterium]HND64767.1 hypothetical protein [Elusimicrobiota bacterium]
MILPPPRPTLALTVLLALLACRGKPTETTGEGTLAASGAWDFDRNGIVQFPSGQFSYGWYGREESHLTGIAADTMGTPGDRLAPLGDRPIEGVTLQELKTLPYSHLPIVDYNHKTIHPGFSFAVQLRDGRYAKVTVTGYTHRRDFTFTGADTLSKFTKEDLLKGPDNPDYNLKVRWVLYGAS